MASTFSASRPFDHLEVVATLGVGGFGRVELVSPPRRGLSNGESFGICCDCPVGPTGEGAGQGRGLRAEGHQEEARGGQPAGGAHPLGEKDPRRGPLAVRGEVSPPRLDPNSILFCSNRVQPLCESDLASVFLPRSGQSERYQETDGR